MTFAYDSAGNRTTISDSSGRYTYTYDELSRMKTVTLPSAQRMTYAYDAASRRSVLRAPTGGRFTYRYDVASRITEVRNPEDSRTTYAYDAAGRRTVKRLSNATRTSFTYDNADQVTTVANMNKTATGFLTKFDYKYDPAGNRLAVKENSGDRVTWTYDATNQLLSERRNGANAYRNTFTYDSRGNRLLNNQGGTRTTTTYDAANQIRYSQAAAGRTTYTFDANGNQQRVLDPSGNRTTTTWDFENQPTLFKLPAGTRVTMAYNADNQRVQKDASTANAPNPNPAVFDDTWDYSGVLDNTGRPVCSQGTMTWRGRTRLYELPWATRRNNPVFTGLLKLVPVTTRNSCGIRSGLLAGKTAQVPASGDNSTGEQLDANAPAFWKLRNRDVQAEREGHALVVRWTCAMCVNGAGNRVTVEDNNL